MISAFSSGVLSYGNFSGVFKEGPNLYVLSPLAVLLDAGRADGAVSSLLAYEAEEKDYDAPEQPERW